VAVTLDYAVKGDANVRQMVESHVAPLIDKILSPNEIDFIQDALDLFKRYTVVFSLLLLLEYDRWTIEWNFLSHTGRAVEPLVVEQI